jgi:hypothetical protein
MQFQEKLSKLRLKKKIIQNLQTVLPKQQQQNPIPQSPKRNLLTVLSKGMPNPMLQSPIVPQRKKANQREREKRVAKPK